VIATPVCTARSCTFSATGSADPDGDTYTYLWDFGTTPATTSTTASPTKLYAADGTYTVTLTLTDVWGAVGTITRQLVIAEPASNQPPVAVISDPVCNARSCMIPGVSSSDPNGDAITYLWTFSDVATTSTSSTATKSYTADGTYTVTLTVTDAWGDTDVETRQIVIAKPANNAAPTAVIGTPSCTGRFCTFSSAASFDADGNTFTYQWIWGDATANTTTANPSHTFPAAGTYTVTLNLTDGWGDVGTTTRQVTVA
ncbi:MAG: PKD domain-containing protein, partial [Ilumatobacteraceae bacterium]